MKDEMKIRKNIAFAITHAQIRDLARFMQEHCEGVTRDFSDMDKFVNELSEFIFNAPKEVKEKFLDWFDDCDEVGLRVCDVCGEFMSEGYITSNYDYYCSDECRLKDYMDKYADGDKERAQELIDEDFTEDSDDYYYTEWS